jgi:hypothetical protein
MTLREEVDKICDYLAIEFEREPERTVIKKVKKAPSRK